jgi:hypothetical protein
LKKSRRIGFFVCREWSLALARSSSQQIFRAMGIASLFRIGAGYGPTYAKNISIPGRKAREGSAAAG